MGLSCKWLVPILTLSLSTCGPSLLEEYSIPGYLAPLEETPITLFSGIYLSRGGSRQGAPCPQNTSLLLTFLSWKL